jgi:hypothetical protein
VGANLDVSSNGGMQITAPTTGTYQGVAIFFDRCNSAMMRITANGGTPITGAIYAKAAALQLTANGSVSVAGLVITATTQLSSSGSLTINYNPADPAQAVQAQWLSWGRVRLVT